jgi:hypothetical protein
MSILDIILETVSTVIWVAIGLIYVIPSYKLWKRSIGGTICLIVSLGMLAAGILWAVSTPEQGLPLARLGALLFFLLGLLYEGRRRILFRVHVRLQDLPYVGTIITVFKDGVPREKIIGSGGTLYLPSGKYEFRATRPGVQTDRELYARAEIELTEALEGKQEATIELKPC